MSLTTPMPVHTPLWWVEGEGPDGGRYPFTCPDEAWDHALLMRQHCPDMPLAILYPGEGEYEGGSHLPIPRA